MNMNRQMKLPEIQKIMQEFEKQSEIMDMKEEMMNDVIGQFSYITLNILKLYVVHDKINMPFSYIISILPNDL